MAKILIIILLGLAMGGCASAPYIKPVSVQAPTMPGIYHRVQKGQTLWKISKIYSIDLDELTRVNHITNNASVEAGQQIFIPNRTKAQMQTVHYGNNEDFIWPLRGRVTGLYGQTINNMLNKGINIEPTSSLDVRASRGGKVVFLSDHFSGLGKTIILDHGDGLFTVYARNSEVFVKPGDNVEKGFNIARAGASGRDRNTYLHFEVRRRHLPENPLYYLP